VFAYNVKLALKSMRRNPVMTGLTVAAIAVGIGISMTTLTVHHMMSNNPIPQKSDVLFAVTLDSWGALRPFEDDRPERAPHQLTFRDAEALYENVAEHHDHCICTSCGTIIEFENDRIESLQQSVAQAFGFRLVSHKMELYGICADCGRRGESSSVE